jgi:tetratricopeptide (TPR) repeat protein
VLFDNQATALLAVLVQTLYYLSDISSNDSTGYGFFLRLIEDKFILRFILLPLAVGLTLRYFKRGGRGYLVSLVVAILGLGFVHPMGTVLYGISCGLFFLTTLVCAPQREKLVRAILIVAVTLVVFVVPLVQRQQEASSASSGVALDLEESLEKTPAASRLTVLNTSLYVAAPRLIGHPLLILAIVLTPWLFRHLRPHLSAQFMFGNMIGVLMLCYIPVITPILGKLIAPGMLWRVLWVLPVSPIITFSLVTASQKLISRLGLTPRYWLQAIPVGVILICACLLQGSVVDGLEKLEEMKSTALTREEIKLLTYLREHGIPGSLVITPDHRIGEEFSGLVGHSYGTNARNSEQRLGLPFKDVKRFHAARFVTNTHLDILQQGPCTYVILETGTELSTQFKGLSNMFECLYANQHYALYQWRPDLATEAEIHLIQGNTYLSQGDWAGAKDAYEEVLQQAPEHPLAFIGLGIVAETGEDVKEAFEYYRQAIRVFPEESWLRAKSADVVNIDPDYLAAYLATGEHYRVGQVKDWQNSKWATYDFLEHLDSAQPSLSNKVQVRRSAFVIDKQPRGVLFQHPPSQLTYSLDVPASAHLSFSLALAPEVWKLGKGDGVQFDIDISNEDSRWHLFSEYIDPKNVPAHRRWNDREISLYRWAGQVLTLTFATRPGLNDDNHYDWAGWGEPRIVQPIAYDFLDELPNAEVDSTDEEQTRHDSLTIDYEPRPILFQHPASRVVYRLDVPESAGLYFGLGIDPAVWSPDKGDGVEYNVYVQRADEPYRLHRVFHRYVDPKHNPEDRRWIDQTVGLDDYGGQMVDIIFEALPGPAGDANFDWGGWSMPVLVAHNMVLQNSTIQVTVESK